MRLRSAVLAAGATVVARAVTERVSMPSWDRPSFRGTPVSLTGGLQVLAGSMVASCVSAVPAASVIATSCGALAGYVDDHLEDSFPARGKGFKGHIGALRDGKVTSGLLKIGIIGLGSIGAAVAVPRGGGVSRVANVALDSLLIASTANLVNLLDLRPGRALKVTGALSAPLVASSQHGAQATALVTTSLAAMPTDLAGKTMLGDLGANAVGAQLGVLLAASAPAPVRASILGGNIALTYASEKISFSKVIEENRVLSIIDSWGR